MALYSDLFACFHTIVWCETLKKCPLIMPSIFPLKIASENDEKWERCRDAIVGAPLMPSSWCLPLPFRNTIVTRNVAKSFYLFPLVFSSVMRTFDTVCGINSTPKHIRFVAAVNLRRAVSSFDGFKRTHTSLVYSVDVHWYYKSILVVARERTAVVVTSTYVNREVQTSRQRSTRPR